MLSLQPEAIAKDPMTGFHALGATKPSKTVISASPFEEWMHVLSSSKDCISSLAIWEEVASYSE